LSERVADLLRPEIDALSRPSPWAGVAAWWPTLPTVEPSE